MGCRGRRTEAVEPAQTEQVDHTFDQRRFGADDCQLHVLFGEVRQLLDGQHIDSDVFTLCFSCRACIAGRDEHFLYAGILRDLPGQGMLAAAAADN